MEVSGCLDREDLIDRLAARLRTLQPPPPSKCDELRGGGAPIADGPASEAATSKAQQVPSPKPVKPSPVKEKKENAADKRTEEGQKPAAASRYVGVFICESPQAFCWCHV